MLSVLGSDAGISVLLSPGRRPAFNDGAVRDTPHKRPGSATKEFFKKVNPAAVDEFFTEESHVFPWQAQMFTTEWNKIVASGVRGGGGGGGGNKRNSVDAGLKTAMRRGKRLNARKKKSALKWKEETLPPLPEAKDLMKRCTLLLHEQREDLRAIEVEKRRLVRLYGGSLGTLDLW